MLDVFSTRDSNMDNKFISHLLKEKNRKDSEGKSIVEVSEEVLNQLHSVHFFFSKKKVKMFSASKVLGLIKRLKSSKLKKMTHYKQK